MFVKAIDKATQFTRPVHFVLRNYGSDTPYATAATLFVVNADGWALTCKHVAASLLGVAQVNAKYAQYSAEFAAQKGKLKDKHLRKQLGATYAYSSASPVQALTRFVNCVDTATVDYDIVPHQDLDLALLRFKAFNTLGVVSFPTFAKHGSDLKQGKQLCRLGFPFAEFTNFAYDKTSDSLVWTQAGQQSTPQFPIDGMVSRHLIGPSGSVVAFEISTPGLKGQSGGPAFDVDARIWGMQFATNHLDLDFDIIDREVLRDGIKKNVNDRPFLHVGQCIHVDVLKEFMAANNVHFDEG